MWRLLKIVFKKSMKTQHLNNDFGPWTWQLNVGQSSKQASRLNQYESTRVVNSHHQRSIIIVPNRSESSGQPLGSTLFIGNLPRSSSNHSTRAEITSCSCPERPGDRYALCICSVSLYAHDAWPSGPLNFCARTISLAVRELENQTFSNETVAHTRKSQETQL